MTMRKAIEVVTKLGARGVIKNYAVTGAVAALKYIEPMLTQDLDVLVSVGDFDQRNSGLVLLGPIESALAEMGYSERSDAGIRDGNRRRSAASRPGSAGRAFGRQGANGGQTEGFGEN